MQTRELKTRSGATLPFSLLGFGGAPLGNLYAAIPENLAQATLDAARAAGVTYFDTAPLYGLGLSEERFGVAFKRWGRKDTVLSTKIGRVLEDCAAEETEETIFVDTPHRRFTFDYSYDGVMRSYEDSLARLGVDSIDVLFIHDVDVWTHGSAQASDARIKEVMEGGYRALEKLRSSGAIKAFGAGVNEWEICQRLANLGEFDCFLLAGRYTLLEQGALTSFLPLCERQGIGIVLGGPYNSGILATGSIENAKYNYADAPPDIIARVRKIERVCAAHNVGLAQAALQFVAAHPAMVSIIPGAVSPDEVERNAATLAAPIPAALWSDLKAQGLVRPDAPVPAGPAVPAGPPVPDDG